jgi:hypothetical protein
MAETAVEARKADWEKTWHALDFDDGMQSNSL